MPENQNSKFEDAVPPVKQTYTQIFLRFLKYGLLAWGGPIAQIAMIREDLVEEEKWISREQFNRVLAVYQALPGPEAHELCVYFGMRAAGRWGGVLAGLGFMLPGFILMLLLTWFYVEFGITNPIIKFIFAGFHAAVIALIFSATHRLSKHALVNTKLFFIAILTGVAFYFKISFFLILPVAGTAYVLMMNINKKNIIIFSSVLLSALAIGILLTFSSPSENSINSTATKNNSILEIIYSGLKGGLLTFGGAYTSIPFVQQDAVINNGWMTNQEFLDGIALSGILPAPLIIFTTFVGYFAGGWGGAVVMTIAIFFPAFAFTIFGHNYIQNVIENASLHNFLDGITAGVMGIIAVTAILLFQSAITSIFLLILFLISLAMLYLIKSRFTVVYVILTSGILSLLYNYYLQ